MTAEPLALDTVSVEACEGFAQGAGREPDRIDGTLLAEVVTVFVREEREATFRVAKALTPKVWRSRSR
eukprot:707125-Heterocapsa_arctica.AAC.1